MAERAYEIAQLAHAFRVPMSEVRRMPRRDIDAMSRVLIEEHQEQQRQAQIAQRKRR